MARGGRATANLMVIVSSVSRHSCGRIGTATLGRVATGKSWPIPEWRLGKAGLRKAVIAAGEPAQRQATISGRSVDRPLWMAPALQV